METEPVGEVVIPGGLRNRRVQSTRQKRTPEVPPHLFGLHTVGVFVGSCGSGKSHAIANLVREYLDYGSYNRVYVISPTFQTNECFDLIPEIRPDDVYVNAMDAQSAVSDIIRKIGEHARLYEAVQEYAKIHAKWKRREPITAFEADMLERTNYEEPPNIPWPSSVIVIDDMSHSDIFNSSPGNPFINLVLRHRHVHGVGCSIFFCTQTFRTGVPRALRQGAIRQIFMFPTKDRSQTDALYEEVANLLTKEQFYSLYHSAIDGRDHGFLTIDNFPPGKTSAERRLMRYRRDFDTFLVADGDDQEVNEVEDEPVRAKERDPRELALVDRGFQGNGSQGQVNGQVQVQGQGQGRPQKRARAGQAAGSTFTGAPQAAFRLSGL